MKTNSNYKVSLVLRRVASVLVAIIIIATTTLACGKTIYVDDDATGLNNGTSWVNAYVYLQDALADANDSEKPVEIRLAKGVYKPDNGVNQTLENQVATFQLINGVAIRGGYAGCNEGDPNVRNFERFTTILSGDLADNDVTTVELENLLSDPRRQDNSYHVVTSKNVNATAVLEGITITGGNANKQLGFFNSGAAIYCERSCPCLIHCILSSNCAMLYGGGMYNSDSSPFMRKCVINKNFASNGGGMHNEGSSPRLIECQFMQNSARGSGGGICNGPNTGPTLTSCVLEGNSAHTGGGMYNDFESFSFLAKCVLTKNSAWYGGGLYDFSNRTTLMSCTISENTANTGAGTYNAVGYTLMVNCVFAGNLASYMGGGINNLGEPTLTNCTIVGNAALSGHQGSGGGIHGLGGATLSNCIVWGNNAYSPGTEQYSPGFGTAFVKFSCIQDDDPDDADIPFEGVINGNIDDDPLFIDPGNWIESGVWRHGDYHLQEGSPCIDAGDIEADINATTPGRLHLVGVDCEARIRVVDDPNTPDTGSRMEPIVDIGAYEFGSHPITSQLFVDANATGMYNGTAWVNAFTNLDTALRTAAASGGAIKEVRVAAGRYTPDPNGVIDPRKATFKLVDGVTIKGGYAGLAQPDPNDRNVEKYRSVLSGDLMHNDVDVNNPYDLADYADRQDNCYHVVTSHNVGSETVIDGFIVKGGNANGDYFQNDCFGGGLYCVHGCPLVTSCKFTQNTAYIRLRGRFGMGGGIYSNRSCLIIANCIFNWNSANDGGGLYNIYGNHTLTNCVFNGNMANNGGGVYNGGDTLTFNNCILWNNAGNSSNVESEQILCRKSVVNFCCIEGWTGTLDGNNNIGINPLFVDSENGDFHLKSQTGRWDTVSGSWVVDDVTSPCIDAGDPNSPICDEPEPNGGRINMGAYGGTEQASMSQQTEELSLPDVAYIYLDEHAVADSFKALLDSYGCPTTLIKTKNVTATSLDSCELIIVADDTFYVDAWTEPDAIAAIEDSGKPIIGLGAGGYDFFGQLGLSIGSPYGSSGSHNDITVIDPNYPIFRTPYPIDIPQDGKLQLYTETRNVSILYWPEVPETVTVLALLVNESAYYPLVIEHDRYFLWGFTESPEKMTETGKKLFINTVIWTANIDETATLTQ